MKILTILFICLLLSFSIGCDKNASSENKTPAPAGGSTDMPLATVSPDASPTETQNSNANNTPSRYLRYCEEPEEYKELEKFLRGFGFGNNERLESSPGSDMWRAACYDSPVKTAIVQICSLNGETVYDEPLPCGGTQSTMGVGIGNPIKVRHVEKIPAYAEGQPFYLVDRAERDLVFTDHVNLYLNGYGITAYSYPITADPPSSALELYVKYDLNREIDGEKAAGEPYCLYRIYYCDYEIISIEQMYDIGADSTAWAYKQ